MNDEGFDIIEDGTLEDLEKFVIGHYGESELSQIKNSFEVDLLGEPLDLEFYHDTLIEYVLGWT